MLGANLSPSQGSNGALDRPTAGGRGTPQQEHVLQYSQAGGGCHLSVSVPDTGITIRTAVLCCDTFMGFQSLRLQGEEVINTHIHMHVPTVIKTNINRALTIYQVLTYITRIITIIIGPNYRHGN